MTKATPEPEYPSDSPIRKKSSLLDVFSVFSPKGPTTDSQAVLLASNVYEKAMADGVLTTEERHIMRQVIAYAAETEASLTGKEFHLPDPSKKTCNWEAKEREFLKRVGEELAIDQSVLQGMCNEESEGFITKYLLSFIVTLIPTQFLFRERCKEIIWCHFKSFYRLPFLIVFVIFTPFYLWLQNLADLFIRLLRLFGFYNFWNFLRTDATLLKMGQDIRERLNGVNGEIWNREEVQKLLKWVEYMGKNVAEQGDAALDAENFCTPDVFINDTTSMLCNFSDKKIQSTTKWALQPWQTFVPTEFTNAAQRKFWQVFEESTAMKGDGVADEHIMNWFQDTINLLPKKAMELLCECKMCTVGNLSRFVDSEKSCSLACRTLYTGLLIFVLIWIWRCYFPKRKPAGSSRGRRFVCSSIMISLPLLAVYFSETANKTKCNRWLNKTWDWLQVWKGCEDFTLFLLTLFIARLIEWIKEQIEDYINPKMLKWSLQLGCKTEKKKSNPPTSGAGGDASSSTGAQASASTSRNSGVKRKPADAPGSTQKGSSAKKQKTDSAGSSGSSAKKPKTDSAGSSSR